jgi:hypothetical protein
MSCSEKDRVMPETEVAREETEAPKSSRGADQRTQPRYCSGTVTLTRVALSAPEKSYFAWIHDVSEEGVGLDLLSALPVGARLVFELSPGMGRPIRFRARVMHTTVAGSFYRVGCKLVRPLRPSVMQDLLRRIRGGDSIGD